MVTFTFTNDGYVLHPELCSTENAADEENGLSWTE